MPKAPKSPGGRDSQRHNPLTEDYLPSQPLKQKSSKRKKNAKDDDESEHFVDSKSSRKILRIGQDLADEDEQEQNARRAPAANPAFAFDSRFDGDEDVEEVGEYDNEEAWGDEEDEEVEEIEIDPSDLETFNRFIPTDDNPIVWPGQEVEGSGPGTNLADLILQKIAAHEAGRGEEQEIMGPGDPDDAVELPAKVVEVYSKYGSTFDFLDERC
jgi:essential nuclear protein 1